MGLDVAVRLVGEGRRRSWSPRCSSSRCSSPPRACSAGRARGQLPARFQLLWTRVVEPDPKIGDPGAIYLWVEEVDENNVPSGMPRVVSAALFAPARRPSLKARDEIMAGNPQEGIAEDHREGDDATARNTQEPMPRRAQRPAVADLERRQRRRSTLDQVRLCKQAQRAWSSSAHAGADAAAQACPERRLALTGARPLRRVAGHRQKRLLDGRGARRSPRAPPAWCRPAPCRDAAR